MTKKTLGYNELQNGYITLISILVVGAVSLAITTSLLLLGLGWSQTSLTLIQSNQAKSYTTACAEIALQEIRNSVSYSGSGSLTFSRGTCVFVVTKQSGQNRTITASGQVGQVVRKVRVVISKINPNITVTSWQEVANL